MSRYLAITTAIILAVAVPAARLTVVSAAPLDPVQQIGAGFKHTCALVSSGAVYCWGAAKLNGSDLISPSATRVNGLENVKSISVGIGETCAIDRTDHAWCWGVDWKASKERKSLVKSHVPMPIEGLPTVAQLALGYDHACAISKSDGSVWCWGSNPAGELGDGTTVGRLEPARAGVLTRATSISVGVNNTCAVVDHDEVYCWGTDNQSGSGIVVKSKTPAKIDGLRNVAKVVNGRNFFCALFNSGQVACFGSNIFTQLGSRIIGQRYALPVLVELPVATDISANIFGACAAAKKVYCWGRLALGQEETEPTAIEGLDDVKSVALGTSHACALLSSGQIKCWGESNDGKLGNGDFSFEWVPGPTEVMGLP
jgi:alpha-tubulin suppressor-like RCC1 family protein